MISSDLRLNYLNTITKSLDETNVNELEKLAKKLIDVRQKKGNVYIVGNGASASISDHYAVDLTKMCGVSARTFHSPGLITCFSNDYGYENWIAKAIEFYAGEKDLIILISSSGESSNIISAAKYCISKKIPLVSLTGFSNKNTLHQLNHSYGISVNLETSDYNVIESVHHIWLGIVTDAISQQ